MTERLRSGMTIAQAIQTAARWWEITGRDMMRRRLVDRDRSKPDGSSEDAELLHRSGVVAGLAWLDLTTSEQQSIVKEHQAGIVSEMGNHNDDTKGKINGTAETRSGN